MRPGWRRSTDLVTGTSLGTGNSRLGGLVGGGVERGRRQTGGLSGKGPEGACSRGGRRGGAEGRFWRGWGWRESGAAVAAGAAGSQEGLLLSRFSFTVEGETACGLRGTAEGRGAGWELGPRAGISRARGGPGGNCLLPYSPQGQLGAPAEGQAVPGAGWGVSILSGASAGRESGQEGTGRHGECAVAPGGGVVSGQAR